MSESVMVKLAGKEVALSIPSLFKVREALNSEFVKVVTDEQIKDDPTWGSIIWAAFAAAYCPSLIPPEMTLKAYRWNVSEFGEAVYEHLRSEGATAKEIVNAGLEALKLNRASLAPRESEVAEEAKNS